MTQSTRDKQQAPISKNHVQRKPGGDPGGRYAVQLRAMSFEEGEQLLSPGSEHADPPDSGGLGPVQKKAVQKKGDMPAPGAKSRMSIGSSYKKIYDLEKKTRKAKPGVKKDKLVKQLLERVEKYLSRHSGKKSAKERERVEAVKRLLLRLQGTSKPMSPPEDVGTTVPQSSGPEVTTSGPEVTTSGPEVTTSGPEVTTSGPEVTTSGPEVTTSGPETKPEEDKGDDPSLPPEVTDSNVPTVLGSLGMPVVELGTTTTSEGKDEGTTKVEPPKGESPKDGPSKEEAPKVPDAPSRFGVLPPGVTDEQLGNPATLLPVPDVAKLSYGQLIHYLDTRDKTHVESLRRETAFVGAVMKMGSEQVANIVVRVILRTPGSVVDRGGARDEAIRILTSQLRSPAIAKKMLTGDVLVVIVPKNMLMTDLPEFQSVKGTYTFDGRPWDTTRGLGGETTAITEENLLGDEIGTDPSLTKKGWANQTDYEDDTSKGTTTKKTKDYNPGVYCSGYSTTNHEFFHTIHQYGLSANDSQMIDRLYNAKKSQPRTVQWADGPRQNKDGTDSENYASSTVYEYFAQTGCAFQGTNTGTDSYTGRPRNNGRKWVNDNEPGLAGLLTRICSDDELKKVNPREQRAKDLKIKNGDVGKSGESRALSPTGLSKNSRLMANRALLEKKLAPQNPPGVLVEK